MKIAKEETPLSFWLRNPVLYIEMEAAGLINDFLYIVT
jgi:hypothetical protein